MKSDIFVNGVVFGGLLTFFSLEGGNAIYNNMAVASAVFCSLAALVLAFIMFTTLHIDD